MADIYVYFFVERLKTKKIIDDFFYKVKYQKKS